MAKIPSMLAFVSAMAAGVYLVMNEHPVLGGWILILSLIGTWGFEKSK